MFKWLLGLFSHDTSSKPEEYVNSGTDCSHESVQVQVDVEIPDFLTEVSADNNTDPLEQESPFKELNDDREIGIDKFADVSDSLLDNRHLVKVFSECADLLNEIDRISPRFKSPDSQLLMEMINERLRSALYLSGGKPVEGDVTFDPIRHICPESPMAKEGTPINEIVEPGVALESRVFIKAKVKLQEY